jgi:hypothetical protein
LTALMHKITMSPLVLFHAAEVIECAGGIS